MTGEDRISRVFIELADTLVDDYDVIGLMHVLADRSVQMLSADAAGIILKDARGRLEVMASTSQSAGLFELFELQNAESPCLDCVRSGRPVVNVSLRDAARRWPASRPAPSSSASPARTPSRCGCVTRPSDP